MNGFALPSPRENFFFLVEAVGRVGNGLFVVHAIHSLSPSTQVSTIIWTRR